MKKLQLICIDPQNSFCKVVPPNEQQTLHDGELCVAGAWDDMVRVAGLVSRLDDKLDDITVTLDSHNILHIAHPMWFKNVRTGANPQPFTMMRVEGGAIIGATFNIATGQWDDVGEFRTAKQALYKRTVEYLKALSASKKYPHIIWPPHCIIGTLGHNVVAPLMDALLGWEQRNVAFVQKVTKGSNIYVEHFSAVQAEVVDPEDPTTQLNTGLIQSIMEADEILASGEARSHCLANTLRDIANTFKDDSFLAKLILLTDGTSDVTGFEKYGEDFVKEMTARGMRTTTCKEYLA